MIVTQLTLTAIRFLKAVMLVALGRLLLGSGRVEAGHQAAVEPKAS